MDLPVRMVALDLDGTALDPLGRITVREEKALRRAMSMGVHIVVATGRAFHSLPDEVLDFDGIEYAVTSNGAQVTRLKDKKLIYENCIGAASACAIADILEKSDVRTEAFTDGRAYIDRREFEAIRDGIETTRDRRYVLSTRIPVDNIFDFIREHSVRIENISINYPSDEAKARFTEVLKRIPEVTLTSSFSLNSEIGGATASKADGLSHLMEKLGISREALMACGDSPNDGAMIRMAAIGVAMGNAVAEVKEMADYVTASNSEDGVAKAIERFVLNEDEAGEAGGR